MIIKEFDISIREAERRLSTTLQHKLRIVLRCYTIVNFTLNLENNSFTFNKTNRVRGITLKDSKVFSGTFTLNKYPTLPEKKEYNLVITLN